VHRQHVPTGGAGAHHEYQSSLPQSAAGPTARDGRGSRGKHAVERTISLAGKRTGDSSPLAPPGPVRRQSCSTESRTSVPACVRAPAEKSTADVAASLETATSKLRMSVETFKEVRPLTCADTTTLAAVSAAETGATMASTRTPLSATVKKSARRMVIGDRYPSACQGLPRRRARARAVTSRDVPAHSITNQTRRPPQKRRPAEGTVCWSWHVMRAY
jgi:hypothetical protein